MMAKPCKLIRECKHPLFLLRLPSWVIARSELHGNLRSRNMGGFPCWWWVRVKRRVADERVFVKWPWIDRNIINILSSSVFVWTKNCLIGFRCLFWKGKGSAPCQSMSIRALSQIDRLSSLRFAFYIAGGGQKSLGCLSRDFHCHNITYFLAIVT